MMDTSVPMMDTVKEALPIIFMHVKCSVKTNHFGNTVAQFGQSFNR